MQIGYRLVLLSNGEAIVHVSVEVDVELILIIGGKQIGDVHIRLVAKGANIRVQRLKADIGRYCIINSAIGWLLHRIANQSHDTIQSAVAEAVVTVEIVLIANVGTQLVVTLGD